MLFMLLFVPTRMVAQTDPRCALFNSLEGITDVTITDNGDYPWQMMDLKAEGMTDISFEIPEGSTGLMSSNYNVEGVSTSETVVNFKVEKPIFLTFKHLVSSESYCDKTTITIDNKKFEEISGIRQIEIKESLSAGEHTLKLSYQKDYSGNNNADRTFIYDLKTATSISDNNYIAEYNAKNTTLTFKKVIDANISDIGNNSVIVEKYNNVGEICKALGNVTIKNIVFEESFKTYAPTSLKEFFYNCISLETISGLEYLNTANITDMSSMFQECSNLKSLDFTNFDTKNVSNMYFMFNGCSTLTSLDLTNFNTAEVRDMNRMFYMLDESSTALTTIYVSDNFVTTNVQNGENMFKNCTKLKGFKKYFLLNTDHQYANYKTGYFTSGCGYAEFDNATGTLTFSNKGVKPEGAYDLNAEAFRPQWKNIETTVKKVVFNASFANAKPTICYAWFYNNSNLTTIEGLEYLNTEDVTNMGFMFDGCSALKSLNLSKFNTAKVTSMKNMFNNCSALKSLNLSGFNTAKVTDMNSMFRSCSALESLDLSMFNTASVGSMPSMFRGATKLKTLNVSSFNTEKVNNMGHMFAYCPNLTSLDLSSFNTKGVEYVDNISKNCSNLTTIYASENFAFGSGLKNGADMFLGCDKLKGFIEYNKNTDTDKNNSKFANYKTGYFTKLVGKNGDEKIGAVGEILTAENLVLDDGKDFVAYEKFAAKDASYSRTMNAGTTWGTLCLPFAIVQSQETECKFYRLTGIDNDNECITLESYEGAEIPAGTPVLFKMSEGEQKLSISAQNAELVKEPVAGTNTDVNLVGSFTKIGGKDNQGLTDTDYIIGKDKFWLVSELKKDGNGKGVGIKPMRAYIQPATAAQARAAMLSIGKGDGTTAIDNLNAISNDANTEYYDANVRRTNGLQKGLNIVKRGSKTYKIMVK